MVLLLTILTIIYSEQAFEAALQGLRIWWEIVFPALLPFFIMAQLLMGLGVVHFFGTLLEPLMRPLFGVPGEGAFAFSMGLAAGYPLGAKISGDLRRRNLCTRMEGERLVSFCNTADPLFMIGAVAVGFYGNASLGVTLSAAHYLSCILVGFLLRFYGLREEGGHQEVKKQEGVHRNILGRASLAQRRAYQRDGRKIGEMLGDSVKDSVNDLLLIGGFIILFSVFTALISALNLWQLLIPLASSLFEKEVLQSLFSGLFEITIGSHLLSQTPVSLLQKMILTSILIAWSGLSVHAQVATMIKGTDIQLTIYLIARVVHALLAGIITLFFLLGFPGLSRLPFLSIPVFSYSSLLAGNYTQYLWMTLRGMGGLLITLTTLSLGIYTLKQMTRSRL